MKLVSYKYDAWGNTSTTYHNGGALTSVVNNPFKYRGYYYDADQGLYYLNTRYYDAKTGRFISADDVGYLGANGDLNSYNLYAYCSNNPIMYADPSGNSIITTLLIGAAIGFVIGSGSKYVTDVMNEIKKDGLQSTDFIDPFKENWKEYVVSGLEGAVAGCTYSVGLGLGAAAFSAGTTISMSTALTSFALTTAGSFASGMGVYALETKVFDLKTYDEEAMWKSGAKMGLKGAGNFGIGLLIGNQGFYPTKGNLGNEFVNGKGTIAGTFMRSYLKMPILLPFEMGVDAFFGG